MNKPEDQSDTGGHPHDPAFLPDTEVVVERLGGDELETRIVTHYPPEIGLRRFLDGLRTGFFWEILQGELAECDKIMAERGWERTADEPGRFPGDRTSLPYSDLWYAGKIGALCWLVLDWRGKGELPEVALSRIMEIGIRSTEWAWRRKYKAHIVRGDGTLKAAKAGGDSRRDALAGDTAERLTEMQCLLNERPTMGIVWAAETAFKRGAGKSAKANRALWYRHQPK